LIFIREWLLGLEIPLEEQMKNNQTEPMPGDQKPSCGPDSHPSACLAYILSQIKSIVHPINLTVTNWGNFTDKAEETREL
jgi:hypothetical protein